MRNVLEKKHGLQHENVTFTMVEAQFGSFYHSDLGHTKTKYYKGLCTHQLTHWDPFFLLLESEKESETRGDEERKGGEKEKFI